MRQSYLIYDLQLWRGELLHTPLSTRGWVLQEEILAPRTIYFGPRQVLWDCMCARVCETYPDFYPARDSSGPTNGDWLRTDDQLAKFADTVRSARLGLRRKFSDPLVEAEWNFSTWKDFVSHYSLRQLTFPSDKLLAIAGMASVYGEVMQTYPAAGLMVSHLAEGLLWYVRRNTVSPRAAYRAPSWSWASCDGYIVYAKPFKREWQVARAEVKIEGLADTYKDVGVTERLLGDGQLLPLTLQAYSLKMVIDERGNWTAWAESRKVPHLLVRFDTNDDVSQLSEVCGAVICTTAYRLTVHGIASNRNILPRAAAVAAKSAGKLHVAAQGIVLTPVIPTSTANPPSSQPGAVGNATIGLERATDQSPRRYRRIGYFSLEDRKGGSAFPKWVTPGLRIFSDYRDYDLFMEMERFDFGTNLKYLTTFEIV
jgi:hypothetical protein